MVAFAHLIHHLKKESILSAEEILVGAEAVLGAFKAKKSLLLAETVAAMHVQLVHTDVKLPSLGSAHDVLVHLEKSAAEVSRGNGQFTFPVLYFFFPSAPFVSLFFLSFLLLVLVLVLLLLLLLFHSQLLNPQTSPPAQAKGTAQLQAALVALVGFAVSSSGFVPLVFQPKQVSETGLRRVAALLERVIEANSDLETCSLAAALLGRCVCV
jgi:hypothetical protein